MTLKKFSLLIAASIFAFVSCGNKSAAKTTSIEDDTSFKVIEVSPEGQLDSRVKYPSIQIIFNRPVTALSKLGKPSDKSDVAEISPSLKGVWRWYGTSVLSFESADEALPQREYTITVNPSLKSISGESLSGNNKFSFVTEDLCLESITAGFDARLNNNIFPRYEIPTNYAGDVVLYFNNKVNPKVISKYIKLTDETNGEDINFSLVNLDEKTNPAGKMVRIKASKPLSDNCEIKVTVVKGALPDTDARPTQEEFSKSYNTLKDFIIEETDGELSSWGRYSNPVRIRFNHQLVKGSEAEWADYISTEPEMKITDENLKISGSTILVFGLPVDFESTYTLKVKPGIKDIYGKTLVNKVVDKNAEDNSYSFQIKVPSADSKVNFKDFGFHILEAQFEPNLAFQIQNIVQQGYYDVEPLRGGSKNYSDGDFKHLTIDSDSIEKNKMLTVKVPLSQSLEKTPEGLRGAIKFDALLHYKHRFTNWRTQEKEEKIYKSENQQVIQVTDLGVTARIAYNKIIVMVTKLSTGEPVPNAEVYANFFNNNTKSWEIINFSKKDATNGWKTEVVKTDKNGYAEIRFKNFEFRSRKLVNDRSARKVFIDVQTENDHVIFAPEDNQVYDGNWWYYSKPEYAECVSSVVFMFTDRGLYKPGEKVKLRGIDRTLQLGKYEEYTGSYHLELIDGKWNPTVYAKTDGINSESGTFTWELQIPANIEPGSYSIRYKRINNNVTTTTSIPVQIQFFQRLKFEANASIPEQTYYAGDKLTASIEANYLGGGSMGGSKVNAYWTREPSGFSAESEKFKNFRFGPIIGYDGREWLNENTIYLSADGKGTSEQKTDGAKLLGMAYTYNLQANVTDKSNQQISVSKSVKVNPARYYIGLSGIKNQNGFPKKGDKLKFEYVLLTPSEKFASPSDIGEGKSMTVKLIREEWKEVQQLGWDGQINTRYQREMVTDVEEKISLKAGSSINELTVSPKNGGSHILRVSSTDKKGNEVVTETRFYVTSGDWYWFNRDSSEEITLMADKSVYKAGEKAKILMQSPIPAGRYMMTIEREGIISSQIFTADSPTKEIEVEIEEDYLPHVYVTLSSFSLRSSDPVENYDTPDLGKPKGYFGYVALNVDPELKKFDVEITSDKENYRPAEKATLKIHVSKDGKPLSNSELTVMAVDRGVIDLINYHVSDPISYFYDPSRFVDYVMGGDSRKLLIDPVTYEVRNLFGGDSEESDDDKGNERKNFEPTALFIPEILTDDNGDAEVSFTLPDTLTAYRITVFGVKKDQFGLQESQINVNNPVSVREVLPSNLRLDDESEIGAVISNLTDEEQQVQLSVEFSNSNIYVTGSDSSTIRIPANSTKSLMFPVKAYGIGTTEIKIYVNSELVKESITKELEIVESQIYETVTTVGELRSKEGEEIASIDEVLDFSQVKDTGNTGSLRIQLDSSRMGILKDAVDYVWKYPYGCLEQRSSRILPLVAFGNYLKVFDLESEVKNQKKVVESEFEFWKKSQLPSGGFPYWPAGNYESEFVSLRIAEILSLAKEKGYSVDSKMYSKLSSYVNWLVSTNNNYHISEYLKAYSLYVQSLMGNGTVSYINELAGKKNLSVSEYSLLGLAYLNCGEKDKAEAMCKKVKNACALTAQGIDLQKLNNSGFWYTSESEHYATALMLISSINNEDIYNSHLVYQLLQMQQANKGGYWRSTATTSRVLVAFDKYIRVNNLQGTNYKATALLNNEEFLSGKFKGAGAEPVEKVVELEHKKMNLNFKKEGSGILYYTVSAKYPISAEEQTARDEGICIFTEIYDPETGDTVDSTKLENGKTYKERVYISSTKSREFLAVRVPVAAGTEILNAAFTTVGDVKDISRNKKENYGLSHQEIYPVEIQYFWDNFYRGNQIVEFYFRANREGKYKVPSATAECMYEPEIFGRTQGYVSEIK